MVPFLAIGKFAALMLIGDIIGVIAGILLAEAFKLEEAGTTWKLLVLISDTAATRHCILDDPIIKQQQIPIASISFQ